MRELDWYVVAQYNCADSYMTFRLHKVLEQLMIPEGVWDLFTNLYPALSNVLLDVEA